MDLSARKGNTRTINRITGVGNKNDISLIYEGKRNVTDTLLGPYEGKNFRFRVENYTEPLLIPISNCLP